MLRRITLFVGLTLVFGVVILSAQGKPVDEPIKVETKLVSVPTIVSDRDGRYIPNLTAADFTLGGSSIPHRDTKLFVQIVGCGVTLAGL